MKAPQKIILGKAVKTGAILYGVYREDIDKKAAAVLIAGIWLDRGGDFVIGAVASHPLFQPVMAAFIVAHLDKYGPMFLEWVEDDYQPFIQKRVLQGANNSFTWFNVLNMFVMDSKETAEAVTFQ